MFVVRLLRRNWSSDANARRRLCVEGWVHDMESWFAWKCFPCGIGGTRQTGTSTVRRVFLTTTLVCDYELVRSARTLHQVFCIGDRRWSLACCVVGVQSVQTHVTTMLDMARST